MGGVGIEINFYFVFVYHFTNYFTLTVNTPKNADGVIKENEFPYDPTIRNELLLTFCLVYGLPDFIL